MLMSRVSRNARRPRFLALLLGVALTAVACSGSGDDAGSDVTSPANDTAGATVASDEPAATTSDESPAGESPTTESTPETTEAPEPTVPADPLMIETTLGPIRGGSSALAGIRNFLAIPFAEPPVGDNAWRPPVPRQPWTEPLDVTASGPSCPQTTEGITTSFVITPDSDPDCLRLSIWSPDDAAGLPVMFWIHGGGFTTGSGEEPYYTGDELAEDGVVVVNVNYRLGVQGFLATDELRADGEDGAVGNYGLLDQQLALEWVRDNIEAFGGDPTRVTIFGESAGGFAVCGHLAAPASQGLFSQAIIQSGGGCNGFVPLESALENGATFLEQIGCENAACLRQRSDDEIIAIADEADFNASLVADGAILDRPAYELAVAGELPGLPVFIGSNADEATLFTLSVEEPDDAELLGLASGFTDDPAALVALYPPDDFESNKARYQAMFTDVRFTCPTLAFASVVDNAFVYHYTYVSEDNPLGLGATHGAELAGLFGHVEGIEVEVAPSDRGDQLSASLQAAWSGFATDGDPGELFDPYSEGATVTLLDVPLEQVDSIRADRCATANELSTLSR
jgi:para-nitrobenzyl esterase